MLICQHQCKPKLRVRVVAHHKMLPDGETCKFVSIEKFSILMNKIERWPDDKFTEVSHMATYRCTRTKSNKQKIKCFLGGLNDSHSCTHVQWPSTASSAAVTSYLNITSDFISSLPVHRGPDHTWANKPSSVTRPITKGKTQQPWCWLAQQNTKQKEMAEETEKK